MTVGDPVVFYIIGILNHVLILLLMDDRRRLARLEREQRMEIVLILLLMDDRRRPGQKRARSTDSCGVLILLLMDDRRRLYQKSLSVSKTLRPNPSSNG